MKAPLPQPVKHLGCYELLEDLALNLHSSWNHCYEPLWKQLDEEQWQLTRNPWAVLQTVSREKLVSFLNDKKFTEQVNDLLKVREDELACCNWFQKNYSQSPLPTIAYFSMEYMLSEALPIYSGGLGNVAGDQLKAASDLGVPVIGIGLLYSQGYFRQSISKTGEQQELFPYNDPGQLPIRPLRKPDGEWLRLKIDLPGWPLWLRTWEVKVGGRKLYLLDSNDIANFPVHRGITGELYGGDKELRLKQELVLGIGGWRLLQALGIHAEICHLNEGHAAFVVLERALSFMKQTQQSFETALTATRAGNLFTTHTAVAAGFDSFPLDLVEKYLGDYAKNHLGISLQRLFSLGQIAPNDEFNMAYLAIQGSSHVNGVSQLHKAVSQHLFEHLFPRWPEEEIPIDYVTNGVHMPSWDSSFSEHFWTEACGKERWLKSIDELEKSIRNVADEKIWNMRNQSRNRLVDYTRQRLNRQLHMRGSSEEEIEKAKTFLNPETLTLGFARRFAPYKRPDLLLYDEARLLRILTNTERPVQLIIAGKAHPADKAGHALIKKWMSFIMKPEARCHVVFLSDDDMVLTQYLIQGVDLWINTPRRPWEACGTSGMKVLVNGGLNLSELDGWWAEAYTPEVGWALGDRNEHGDDPVWDSAEADKLYDLLEKEVIPDFYSRDEQNIPSAWVAKIRESLASLTPRFSAIRAVKEYTEKFYLPALKSYRERAANQGALAKKITDWQSQVSRYWNELKFGELKIISVEDRHVFEIEVFLGPLTPQEVKVELYSQALTKDMEYRKPTSSSSNSHVFYAEVPNSFHPSDFTPRIVPFFPEISVPLESNHILWQR